MVEIVQERFELRNDVGDELRLDGPIYVTAHDGLGLVKPRRYAQTGPQQDGQTLGAAYLNPRVVTFALHYHTDDEPALLSARDELAFMLNNLNSPIHLVCIYPDGVERRLDVLHYDGAMAPRAASDLYYYADDVIQLIADDPVLYEVPLRVLTWSLAEYYYGLWAKGVEVPVEVPIFVGSSTISQVQTLTYASSWGTYPIIRFSGPCTSPQIRNVTTGEKIAFEAGTEIGENDYYEVDCRYGYKQVLNSAGKPRTGELTNDSDLATFHIAPHPEALNGINEIWAVAMSCTTETEIIMQYYIRWWSI
ncbi:MAG TPA: hypothetical protein VMW24_24805 [Sedimentisphaerales bacterium]|nr:hypothetical protein [Sedimentisphaerales bacterium]